MSRANPDRLLTGSELRRLLVLRSRLRQRITEAPRPARRAVLQALERARRARLEGRAGRWTPPDMTAGELLRQIKWLLDASALPELEAADRVLQRLAPSAGASPRRLRPR